MHIYLMDVVDAGVSNSFDWVIILVLGGTILVEAIVMLLMKYNNLKKAALDSLIVNVASLGVGFILIRYLSSLFNSYTFSHLLMLMLVTIIVETGILYILNRTKPFINTLAVSVLMNVVSYALFYLFIHFMNR